MVRIMQFPRRRRNRSRHFQIHVGQAIPSVPNVFLRENSVVLQQLPTSRSSKAKSCTGGRKRQPVQLKAWNAIVDVCFYFVLPLAPWIDTRSLPNTMPSLSRSACNFSDLEDELMAPEVTRSRKLNLSSRSNSPSPSTSRY